MQDYEVVVLVGAGIGVTPFASVLADMVNKLESGVCSDCGNVQHVTAGSGAHVEKIYFRASQAALSLPSRPLLCCPATTQPACMSPTRRRCRAWSGSTMHLPKGLVACI